MFWCFFVLKFFFFKVELENLPSDMSTTLTLRGAISEITSQPTEAGKNQSGYQFEEGVATQFAEEGLFDNLVANPLQLIITDTNSMETLASCSIPLRCFLHDNPETSLDQSITLPEQFLALWDEPLPLPEDAEEDAEPQYVPEDERETTLRVKVAVDDLLGPVEDRHDWVALTLDVKGVYNIPSNFISVDAGQEGIDTHPLTYSVKCFNEEISNLLPVLPRTSTPATPRSKGGKSGSGPEESEVEDPGPSAEDLAAMSEEERQLFYASKRPALKADATAKVVYRGTNWLNEVRTQLDSTGAVYCHFSASQRNPETMTLPPKFVLPDADACAELAKDRAGLLNVEIMNWLKAGETCVGGLLPIGDLAPPKELEEGQEDHSYKANQTFAQVSISLSRPIISEKPTPPSVKELQIGAGNYKAFAGSGAAQADFQQCIDSCLEQLMEDFPGQCETDDFLESLKVRGKYHGKYRQLHEALIPIIRERVRKLSALHQRKGLGEYDREKLLSDVNSYLCRQIADRLETLAKQKGFREGRPDFVNQTIEDQTEFDKKYWYLCREYEICGLWDRAAKCYQNRLVLDDNRENLKLWVEYAKFCLRADDHAEAAEEALKHGLSYETDDQAYFDCRCILTAVYTARGRYREAYKTIRPLVESDFGNPIFNFLIGLNHHLAGEAKQARQHLLLSGRDRTFFKGVKTEQAILDKLELYMSEEESYQSQHQQDGLTEVHEDDYAYLEHLDMLLEVGLPQLVLVILKYDGLFKRTTKTSQRFGTIEAQAHLACRDWVSASTTLENLSSKDHSHAGNHLLQGEARYQQGDLESALVAYETGIQLNENDRETLDRVYLRMASIYMYQERYQSAREAFLSAINQCPSATGWAGVGLAALRDQQPRVAYEALREALLRDHTRADIWAQMVLVHVALDNWTEAESAFQSTFFYF